MAIRVLMVDDDPVHLELSDQFLRRQSPEYEIVSAETAEEAINLLLGEKLDVVVCDIDLGESSSTGLDILEQVRINENDIPVIIFTDPAGFTGSRIVPAGLDPVSFYFSQVHIDIFSVRGVDERGGAQTGIRDRACRAEQVRIIVR